MKKNSYKTGFSLIELIIATVLVSVVLLGIFSINSVLNNNSQDYGQRYLARSETQTTLNHILNNASLAYGSANTNDEAVLIGTNSPGVGSANTFCIHQAAGSNILSNEATLDIWLCYTWSSANYQINYCTMPYAGGTDPRGASSCILAATNNALCTSGGYSASLCTGPTFVGTSYNGITNANPSFTSSSTQTLFAITIQNCLNDSAGSCYGATPDPVNNPEVQLSGSVIPLSTSS